MKTVTVEITDTYEYVEFEVGELVKAYSGEAKLTPGKVYKVVGFVAPRARWQDSCVKLSGVQRFIRANLLIPAEEDDTWQKGLYNTSTQLGNIA